MKLFRSTRSLAVGLFVALVLLTIGEWLFAPHYRPVFPWHRVAGYSALFGLIAAVAFTALTYYVLKPWLQRPEEERGAKERDAA